MMFSFFLFLIVASTASVSATSGRISAPSCYEYNFSWVNGTLDDIIIPVFDAAQCQKLCQDSLNCTSWTWNTDKNHEIKDACILYASTGEKEPFPETVSGPRSCVCSDNVACSATEENLIRVEENVEIEESCQEFCLNITNCNFYTWYDSSESLAHVCVLLTECSDRYEDCTGCHSGPPQCDVEPEDDFVIVVTGGEDYPEASYSAEALNANGTHMCVLPDLPTPRRLHSMSGSMICGGWDNSTIRQSCIKFQNGGWTEFPWKLQEERSDHVSWTRSDGKTRLLGGRYSDDTSELVSENGSVVGFPLKYSTLKACSIEFDDQVIVTGGRYTMTTVSVYNDDGWVQDLAPLNTGRYYHTCSHFTSDNDQKYIVAGGRSPGSNFISSTEIYSLSQMEWSFGAPLPSARIYLTNGISLNNNVFLLGGNGGMDLGPYYSEVLKLDEENGQFIKVGEMSMGRREHASYVLPLKDIQPYCVS